MSLHPGWSGEMLMNLLFASRGKPNHVSLFHSFFCVRPLVSEQACVLRFLEPWARLMASDFALGTGCLFWSLIPEVPCAKSFNWLGRVFALAFLVWDIRVPYCGTSGKVIFAHFPNGHHQQSDNNRRSSLGTNPPFTMKEQRKTSCLFPCS